MEGKEVRRPPAPPAASQYRRVSHRTPRPPALPRPSQMGAFELTAGSTGVDTGIKTSTDARFYSISAPLASEIKNQGKDLIVSYTVRHDQVLDCGGAYVKLLTPGVDQAKFSGDDKYAIMFGPDMCGTSTRKTHVILTYNGKNLLTKKNIKMESDQASHVYTLVLHADNTYEVQIDTVKVESGSLYDDWDFLLPKMIKDPEAKKPSDWVDNADMPDPEDKKPEGYDDIPAKLPDTSAKKPEDWDEEEDGEWTAPQVDNPEYKGVWKAKTIPNPAYKGPWVHPEIANPDFKDDVRRPPRRTAPTSIPLTLASLAPTPRPRRPTCTPCAIRARTSASSSGR